MSAPLYSADLASGCPVVFTRREKPALVFERLSALPKLSGVTSAARLEIRPAPEMVSSGIREIDALTGGLPRGCLTEICGSASSGRTSVLLAALAAATRRQEICALVDASDAFDPLSGAAAGVDFEKMLWVRCGAREEKNLPQRHRDTETTKNKIQITFNRQGHDFSRANKTNPKTWALASEGPLEKALRTTDLLLQSGGFGMIVLDLGDIPFKNARRIPLTTWFRFQRAVETTPTILFVVAETAVAETCASLLLKLSAVSSQLSVASGPSHVQLLDGLHIGGELLRSRQQRKPVQSVTTAFTTKSFKLKAEG